MAQGLFFRFVFIFYFLFANYFLFLNMLVLIIDHFSWKEYFFISRHFLANKKSCGADWRSG